MRVEPYSIQHKNKWDDFVANAKNATFLFQRNFLEYHSNRFSDYSLLIFDNDDKLVSIIPANITSDRIVVSHEGLTYGGIVLQPGGKLVSIIEIVHAVLKFFHENRIPIFKIKSIPSFYSFQQSEELEYIFFLLEANLYRCDTALVIDKSDKINYSGNIRREANKAKKLSSTILEQNEFDDFWNQVLIPNLKDRFGVDPVHTLTEIRELKRSFPDQIRQFNIYLDGEIIAGTTLFITPNVVHCQYISSNDRGRKSGGLNFLFQHLVDVAFQEYKYFDFGIVNYNEGKEINEGMLFWKESFGARTHVHKFYQIQTSNYKKLEKYLNTD